MADQKTILIVDDDRELVDGLRAVLERQGYRVIQAHDGHQAKQRSTTSGRTSSSST